MKNKTGIADVIVTVLLVGLALALGAIVWAVVTNLVNGKLQPAQSCFGNYGELSINPEYTCYNTSALLATKEIDFSILRGDIDVDKITVSISSAGIVKSYTIPGTYANVKMYGAASYGGALMLPNKTEGLTYVSKDFGAGIPIKIEIGPVINGQQCDPSDTVTQIETC